MTNLDNNSSLILYNERLKRNIRPEVLKIEKVFSEERTILWNSFYQSHLTLPSNNKSSKKPGANFKKINLFIDNKVNKPSKTLMKYIDELYKQNPGALGTLYSSADDASIGTLKGYFKNYSLEEYLNSSFIEWEEPDRTAYSFESLKEQADGPKGTSISVLRKTTKEENLKDYLLEADKIFILKNSDFNEKQEEQTIKIALENNLKIDFIITKNVFTKEYFDIMNSIEGSNIYISHEIKEPGIILFKDNQYMKLISVSKDRSSKKIQVLIPYFNIDKLFNNFDLLKNMKNRIGETLKKGEEVQVLRDGEFKRATVDGFQDKYNEKITVNFTSMEDFVERKFDLDKIFEETKEKIGNDGIVSYKITLVPPTIDKTYTLDTESKMFLDEFKKWKVNVKKGKKINFLGSTIKKSLSSYFKSLDEFTNTLAKRSDTGEYGGLECFRESLIERSNDVLNLIPNIVDVEGENPFFKEVKTFSKEKQQLIEFIDEIKNSITRIAEISKNHPFKIYEKDDKKYFLLKNFEQYFRLKDELTGIGLELLTGNTLVNTLRSFLF